MMHKKRALSGMQATGNPHLGNYLGAIKHWVQMQEEYDSFFFLADLHALTVRSDPDNLRNAIIESTASFLACGIDPKKYVLFTQSSVSEHAELGWILNCFTPIGWLKRMTQFKDKAGKNQETANTGLFTYPVLMAADILLYNADVVPVGEDQKQHIELARDIAGALNREYNKEILKVPEPLIKDSASRIMSLRDGTKKMSKSDPSDQSRINLHDSADIIAQKIKRAKTDSYEYVSYDKVMRPEVSNLIEIYSALSGKSREDIVHMYSGKGFSVFKNDLAEVVVTSLSPITNEYNRLLNDKSYILNVLQTGGERAKAVAHSTLQNVMSTLGYVVDTRL